MKTGVFTRKVEISASKRKREDWEDQQHDDDGSIDETSIKSRRATIDRFYHLSEYEINSLERGMVPNIDFPDSVDNFYLVIPDIYKGRVLSNFENAMSGIQALVKITNAAGVLVKPDVSSQNHDLAIYKAYLETNVGIYHIELENPHSPISVRFTQSFGACLMDPFIVEREVILKSQNPALIHEGPTYNCGLASVLMSLATHKAPTFGRIARQIALDGSYLDYVVTSADLRPRDHVDFRKRRTVIEMFINALNNTDSYAREQAVPIAMFFQNFKAMLIQKFKDNAKFKAFIERFFEGRLTSFVSNTPKIVVALLERFGFTVMRERIYYSLLQNFPKQIQDAAQSIIYSEGHSPLMIGNLIQELQDIHDMLEEGHPVITSLNIDYNFKLIKSAMNKELVEMDPRLRPDHMVFTTKLNLSQGEAGYIVDFGFHTFGEHYEVQVDLEEFAQGFRGYISARAQ